MERLMKGKLAIKRETKTKIIDAYRDVNCSVDEKRTGSITYHAISLADSDQRIAAIYGSLGGAASLWIKEGAWEILRDSIEDAFPDGIDREQIQDVDLFRRGYQWAVHFQGPDDPMIPLTIKATIEAGSARWERAQKRRADDARRAAARAQKKAEMDEKRRDPFANN